MEVECGVRIGNPKRWGDGCNKADLPAKGFDDFWIYPLEALDLVACAQFQRAVSIRSSRWN
jgi:hypothetical protein